ncbi:MAG: TIGR02680 family protein, partial [Lachnospiraceae bacterium]|nr:TIGR02680 family protein [Lachnospiraceae bacterium]
LRHQPKTAPVHSDRAEQARHALKEQHIPFLPFYEALDFAEDVTSEKRNQIEGQLLDAGLLDALVVPEAEQTHARDVLAGLSDVLIRPVGKAGTLYPFLRAAAEETELRQETERILCCLRETPQEADEGTETILGSDGYFRNGVLEGYSHAEEEAAYVGAAARRKTKERWIREKEAELRAKEESLTELRKEIRGLEDRLARLEQERDRFPSFDSLHTAIGLREESERERERCLRELRAQEETVAKTRETSTEAGQRVLRCCKPLPCTRKSAYYKEVIDTITEYQDSLISLRDVLGNLENRRNDCSREEEKIQSLEEKREEREWSRRRAEQSMRELQVKMDRLRQTLDAPEMQERSRRLREINRRLEEIEEGERESEKQLAVLRDNVERLSGEIEAQKDVLTEAVSRENLVRRYFEEELRLGLVMRPGEYSLNEAAVKAQAQIRETDRNRHASEVTSSLMRNFQAHLGTLSGYGTTMEPCFEEAEDDTLLRRREQIVSVWNGKKLYLEEFYTVLREAIDSTELLIQEEDRKLFEGILADTLSRKLSQRIRESRSWIWDMSALMREMDTSMGLTFSLDWRPRAAEGEGELDTQELERILARERELLTDEDIEKVSVHFRSRIHLARQAARENGEDANYMELVRDALDYRKWFEFHMSYMRGHDGRKELTNAAFNRFSGGEKAMAMYVPLFAAVNAQYKKATNPDHPRIMALDEAFAGVDDKNIQSMFELVQKLDFDYIMNSQVLWGCYETVPCLRIAELQRPGGSDVVTVITYFWNGRERVLDEQ